MIFYILVTVFVLGFALLSGILSVMRELYAFSTFQGPLIPNDCGAKVSVDFRILCPILPELMSNFLAGSRFTLVLGPQSTVSGDIPAANAPEAAPTSDDSPVRIL
jgi:hypothetical protein